MECSRNRLRLQDLRCGSQQFWQVLTLDMFWHVLTIFKAISLDQLGSANPKYNFRLIRGADCTSVTLTPAGSSLRNLHGNFIIFIHFSQRFLRLERNMTRSQLKKRIHLFSSSSRSCCVFTLLRGGGRPHHKFFCFSACEVVKFEFSCHWPTNTKKVQKKSFRNIFSLFSFKNHVTYICLGINSVQNIGFYSVVSMFSSKTK